jgi:hypothetical protein
MNFKILFFIFLLTGCTAREIETCESSCKENNREMKSYTSGAGFGFWTPSICECEAKK